MCIRDRTAGVPGLNLLYEGMQARVTEKLVKNKHVVILAITRSGDVVHGGTTIGVSGVRATLTPLLRDQAQPVVVQADASVPTELLVKVVDQAKLAGADTVHIAATAEN